MARILDLTVFFLTKPQTLTKLVCCKEKIPLAEKSHGQFSSDLSSLFLRFVKGLLSYLGVLHNVLYVGTSLRGPTLYLFVCYFDRKNQSLVHFVLETEVPLSHTYLKALILFLNPWKEVNEHHCKKISSITETDVKHKISNIHSVHVVEGVNKFSYPQLLYCTDP